LRATKTTGTTGEVVTFLKTSEEAQCDPISACVWTYTDTNIPTISAGGLTSEFDAATGKWLLKIAGTNLRTSDSSGETSLLLVENRNQTLRTHTSTLAVWEVSDITTLNLTTM